MAGSPWGQIQYSKVFERGCRSVGTASHGGFMLTRKYAHEHLSDAAIERAIRYSDYLCYEEDCDACIPMYELRHLWPQFRHLWPHFTEHFSWNDEQEVERALLRSLSYWNAPYVIERGIEPDEEAFQRYLAKEEEREMREDEHPDLIVSAVGDWHESVPEGAVGVRAADGEFHLVTKDSYVVRCPNLLSACRPFK